MKILSVTLFNFCQFDKISYDLTEGITRIYAPNGAGKTNFLRGLVYGLTGWVDPSWGTQSDLQKDDAASPGWAQVKLEIEGSEYTLRRYIIVTPKNGDTLDCDDPKVHIEKRQRVNAFLESKLPVTMPIMAQLMWLRQGNLNWLLTATASSINVFLGLIFDTKKLEKLRDALKLVTSKVADIRGDQEPKLEHWRGVLAQMPDIQGLEKELQELNEKYVELASYTGKRVLRKSAYNQSYTMLDKEIQEKQQTVCACRGAVEEILKVLPSPMPDLTALRKQLNEEKQKAELLVAQMRNTAGHLETCKKRLEILTQASSGKCEYCGAQYENNEEHQKAVMQTMGIHVLTYEQALEQHQKAVQTRQEEYDSLQKELEGLQIEQLEIDISNALDVQTLKAELTKREAILQQQENALRDLRSRFEDLKQAVVIPDNEKPIDEQIDDIKETIATVQQAYNDAVTNKQLAEASIKQLEQEQKEHQLNTYVKRLLTGARDALSQSRAQARYISGKLDTLNGYIEHYLALSEMPFILRLDKDEHTFKYHMQGSEQDHPAGMLSGAQSAAAAIAVQMALVETAYPELSLLLVDEADAALSPENKFIAARLYRTLSNSIDGSVLVISQSEDVEQDCDNTWVLQ